MIAKIREISHGMPKLITFWFSNWSEARDSDRTQVLNTMVYMVYH